MWATNTDPLIRSLISRLMSAKSGAFSNWCGSIPVIRVISGGSGLIFKGSGFYITDYKKKSSGDGSSSDSGSSKSSDSKKD